jgi:hypothetical protein
MYSVQQLLFDAMSYLKEFGAEGTAWRVAAVSPDLAGMEAQYEVWLHRPALSQRAVETVVARLTYRFGLQPLAPAPPKGRYLFLGRCQPSPLLREEAAIHGQRMTRGHR